MSHFNTSNSAIVAQAKQLLLESYQQQFDAVPTQFSQENQYQHRCIIALNMKDAMELYNDQQTTRLELPPIAQIAALFDVFIDRDLDEQLGNDASDLAQHFMEILSDTVFLQLKTTNCQDLDDVITQVKTFSYWSPVWVYLAGHWHDTFKQKCSA